jgi:hypothetical protein
MCVKIYGILGSTKNQESVVVIKKGKGIRKDLCMSHLDFATFSMISRPNLFSKDTSGVHEEIKIYMVHSYIVSLIVYKKILKNKKCLY